MTSRDFAYWLQGLFEIAEPKKLNEKQTQMIKNHLALVFHHEIDPSYSNDPVEQQKMNQIHAGDNDNNNELNSLLSSYPDPNKPIMRC